MPQPIPYLSFNGNCADAMRHYERVFDGDLQALMTYGESPMASESPPDTHHLVMHASLALGGGGLLMAGDAMPGTCGDASTVLNATMMALTYPTVAEAEKVFARLADGGKVTMPLTPTFWAKTFGMVTDKFGVPWGINGEEIKQ
jgi:PhnB protein